jgi:hypothetical protein
MNANFRHPFGITDWSRIFGIELADGRRFTLKRGTAPLLHRIGRQALHSRLKGFSCG